MGNSISNLSHKEAARLRNQNIGFIFQDYNLLPVYNVFENVEFPLVLLKMIARTKSNAAAFATRITWIILNEVFEM